MTADPQLAQQMLDDQTAQVEGAAAARELEALATDLDARGRQLQAIEGQTAEMAEQSPTADGKQLAADQPVANRIGRKRPWRRSINCTISSASSPTTTTQPLAPWTPPGEKFESTPVEEDVPDAEKKDKDKADKNDGDAKDTDAGQA